MKSMTGFGVATLKWKKTDLSCEIRSLNHRFFSLKVMLPNHLSKYEALIEGLIKRYIRRGTVNVSVNLQQREPDSQIDQQRLKYIFKHLSGIKGYLGIKDKLTFYEFLTALQSFNTQGSLKVNPIPFWYGAQGPLSKLICRAMKLLVESRISEGAAIKKDISLSLRSIKNNLGYIQKHHKKPQDVAIDLQGRGDVSEEIHRLRYHLQSFTKLLQSNESIGRRLEFLVQEMFRETASLSSKLRAPRLIDRAIEIKVFLERIREQAENVE